MAEPAQDNAARKPPSLDQVRQMAHQRPSPQLNAVDKTQPKPGKHGGVNGAGKAAGGRKEEKTTLPAEVTRLYRDVDLSNVAVYRNSEKAEQKHVKGFATHDEIYIAPGVDEMQVMRHEAAHVAQLRKGGQPNAQHDSKDQNEHEAKQAEAGGDGKVGAAAPGRELHSEHDHHGPTSSSANDHGAPQLDWNGIHFQGVSGNFQKTLLEHEFEETRLFHVSNFWPFPALPIAGIDVMAEGVVKPEAKLTANGTYSWNRQQHQIQVGANLKGELSCALTARARGGLALNAVIQSGGVGLEASSTVKIGGELTKAINFNINTETGAVELEMVPLEVNIGGTWDAALALVLWTEGWFSNHVSRWTFANFRIATLTGFKFPIAARFNSHSGVTAEVGPAQMGQFSWGAPPAADEHNAHE